LRSTSYDSCSVRFCRSICQAIITWATPTADDRLGVFERYEVEIAQIPYSKDPTDDNITFNVSDPSNLEWISVYSGPDVEVGSFRKHGKSCNVWHF
jgi:hypothetical protein